jgi:hypothetical protein
MNHKMLTVSDLPAAVIADLLSPEYNRVDYYFGVESKHEFFREWKHFIQGQTEFPKALERVVPPTADDFAEFKEIDGRLVLLPLARDYYKYLELVECHESKDSRLLTIFFSARRVPGYEFPHDGMLAIAERYKGHGVEFFLGRYLHYTYLVGRQFNSSNSE